MLLILLKKHESFKYTDDKNLKCISNVDYNLKYKLKLNRYQMNLDKSKCATYKPLIKTNIEEANYSYYPNFNDNRRQK